MNPTLDDIYCGRVHPFGQRTYKLSENGQLGRMVACASYIDTRTLKTSNTTHIEVLRLTARGNTIHEERHGARRSKVRQTLLETTE